MKEGQQTLEHKTGQTEGDKRGMTDNLDWQIYNIILIQEKFMGICLHQLMSKLRSDM
jgi:hypothetical protein